MKIDFSANIQDLTPIPTKYKGFMFRSRLEARWAVFFDELGCKWQYEIQGFKLSAINAAGRYWYLPDFYIENIKTPWEDSIAVWIEIKGAMKKKDKKKCKALSVESEHPVLLIQGDPMNSEITLYRKNTPIQKVRLAVHDEGFKIVKTRTNATKTLMDAQEEARSKRFGS